MKMTGTNPGRGRLQTRLSEVSRYSWVNIYIYGGATGRKFFFRVGSRPRQNTVEHCRGSDGIPEPLYDGLKRRARNSLLPIAIPPSRNFIDIDKWTRPVDSPPLYRFAFFISVFQPLELSRNRKVASLFFRDRRSTVSRIFRKIAYRLYGFLKYLILTILNPSFAHLFLFYRTTPLGDKHCRCDVAGERKETERKVGSLISVTSKFRSLDFG